MTLDILQDIKSYGCHENVLSVRLGGESAEMGESSMVYFKMKEAVVVKEIMDQVLINFFIGDI